MRNSVVFRAGSRIAVAVIATLLGGGLPLFGQLQPQSQPVTDGRVASINGCQIYYEVYGEGRPLVLLHGFQASGLIWKPLVGEFAKLNRVIVPDLRGHGRSTNPTKQFTHRLAALDLLALLDQLKISRSGAIGISSGGMVLLHMATLKPDRIDSMILVSATTYFPEEARAIMRQSTVENMTPEDWEAARQIHKLGDDQISLLDFTR